MSDQRPELPYASESFASRAMSMLWRNRSKKGKVAVVLLAVVLLSAVTAPFTDTDQQLADPNPVAASETSIPQAASAPTVTPQTNPPPSTAPPAPTAAPTTTLNETVSQRNARRSAESYLRFTSFSRDGLIGQLEFEKFSTADATYAVDSLAVDWRDQAVKKAEEYLRFSSFSRDGLIDQLIFEGFTRAEAEHGVNETGL
jgi:type IV secretory pathway VirB10-like protein